jgi:hypothetical protein
MRWTRLTLVITEAFVALSAFGAGAMFVAAPSGRLMGMTEVTLARSPFRNYLVPVERQLHSPGTVNYIAPSAFGVVVVV